MPSRFLLVPLLMAVFVMASYCANATGTVANFGVASNGLQITFSDSSTIAGPTAWQWDFGDGSTDSVANPVHSYAGAGSYTVCLIVTDTCGSDTLCQLIAVDCLPLALAINAATVDGCITGKVGLATTNTGEGLTFQWQENAGSGWTDLTNNLNYSNTTGDSLVVSALTSGFDGNSYRCIAVDACGNADTTASAQLNVHPLPMVTATGSSATICEGDSFMLSATGADAYTWVPSANLQASMGTSVTGTAFQNTNFLVTGTVTTTGCSDTSTVMVVVEQDPNVSVMNGSASICVGESTWLLPMGASTYEWSPDSLVTAGTSDTVWVAPDATTTYQVTGTNAAGCTDISVALVTVVDYPNVLAESSSDTIVCPNDTITLSGLGANTYTWSPSYGLLDTVGANVSATPDSTVTYMVIGAVQGCADTAFIEVPANDCGMIGIAENPLVDATTRWNQQLLRLTVAGLREQASLTLFDLQGRSVYRSVAMPNSWQSQQLLLAPGMYVAVLESHNNRATCKVLVTN